ncbi:MAG: Mitochondrial import inner membrane translocase subunit Tim22, partial [Marteilia pararefringens]
GGVFGGMFGIFMNSIGSNIHDIKQSQTLKSVLKEMRSSFVTSGKSLASVGFLFTFIDSTLQSITASKSVEQGALTGFLTGSLMGFRNSPRTAITNGLGFGLFSLLIECFIS